METMLSTALLSTLDIIHAASTIPDYADFSLLGAFLLSCES